MITTTHKGMTINWAENHDAWSVAELDYKSASLDKCRKKIDAQRAEQDARSPPVVGSSERRNREAETVARLKAETRKAEVRKRRSPQG